MGTGLEPFCYVYFSTHRSSHAERMTTIDLKKVSFLQRLTAFLAARPLLLGIMPRALLALFQKAQECPDAVGDLGSFIRQYASDIPELTEEDMLLVFHEAEKLKQARESIPDFDPPTERSSKRAHSKVK